MATESVATLPASTIEMGQRLFGESPNDVVAAIDTGMQRLYQLGSLFNAIKDAVTPDMKNGMRIELLAELGRDVAEDSANYLDLRREQLETALQAAK